MLWARSQMKWRGPHHGRLLALLPLLALSAAVTAQPAGTTAVPQFGTVEGEVYGSVQLFATPEGSTDIPAGCYQIRYAGGCIQCRLPAAERPVRGWCWGWGWRLVDEDGNTLRQDALEPQWQREAVYGSAAECVAMATLNMGQPVVHRHGGGTLGIRSLETRWLDGTTGPGMPGPTWSLEAAACPDQPPASLPALEWRNLSALPSNSDLPRLKAVAANRKGQMWALRDHIWGMRTGETTWGVYFLRNEVWSEYGGAKCSISVLPSGKVFGTFLAQTAWVISTVPFGTIEWNSYVPYYDFPDQPLLDVAAGPDGRLWFVGTTGVYEYAVATSRYIRLPNLLASPLAIAANSQGPTVVTADHRVWRLAAGIWAEIAPGLRACKVAHAPDDGLWIVGWTGAECHGIYRVVGTEPQPVAAITARAFAVGAASGTEPNASLQLLVVNEAGSLLETWVSWAPNYPSPPGPHPPPRPPPRPPSPFPPPAPPPPPSACAPLGTTFNRVLLGAYSLAPNGAQSCCDLCYGVNTGVVATTCRYYAFSPVTGGCRLYSATSSALSSPPADWQLGQITARDAPACRVAVGTCAHPGLRYLNASTVGVAAPQQCCSKCRATPGCGVWGYTSASGECRLYSGSLSTGACAAPAQAAGQFYGWLRSANSTVSADDDSQPTCSRARPAFTSSLVQIRSVSLGPDAEQACCDLCFATPLEDPAKQCAGYAYGTASGKCQLYTGASTAPLAAPSSRTAYGVLAAGAQPLCTVNIGRCDNGGTALAVVELPFNQPYMCCEECSGRAGCFSWNFQASSGTCTLLASACPSASARPGYFTGTRLAAVRSPPPPPPPPPLDVTIPAGDVCILYSGARKVPKQLLRDITSCACYTTCYGDEACDWRKFCAAGQRRSQCQAAAAQAYDAGNPCPSPPPPPAPATSRDFWATVPAVGSVCALYTTAPSGLLPYRLAQSAADACACYRTCREEYTCDGQVWCPNGANRKDCRDTGPTPDRLGSSNPCPSTPGTTSISVPTLSFEVTFYGFSLFNSTLQAAYKQAIVMAAAGKLGQLNTSVGVAYVEKAAAQQQTGVRIGTRVTFLAPAGAASTQQGMLAFNTSVLPTVGKVAAAALTKFGLAQNSGAGKVRAGTKVVEVKAKPRPPPPPPLKRPPPPRSPPPAHKRSPPPPKHAG